METGKPPRAPYWLMALAERKQSPGKRGKVPPLPEYLREASRLDVCGALDRAFHVESYSKAALQELCSALSVIPADCSYGEWLGIGMALHELGWRDVVGHEGRDIGLEIWDAWSQRVENKELYAGRYKIEEKWKSFERPFSGLKLTIKSIYKQARERGWVAPTISVNNINGVESAEVVLPQALSANPIKWLDFDKYGKPRPTCANTRVAMRRMGVACKYDLFHDRGTVKGTTIEAWSGDQMDDPAVLSIRSDIKAKFGFDPGTQATFDAIMMECIEHAYDPVCDYLASLEWDGVKRLPFWLCDFLGAERSKINAVIGSLMLVAAVRRARQPGVKFDQIMVLEGLEGMGKSSAVAILAGQENFSDQELLTLNDRAQQEQIQGVWLYELADLAGLPRADIERVKAFASRTVDRARPAYGRKRVDKPRRCVFFASCNDEAYLLSQTGNRRFWPVKCRRVKLKELREARDQLWAEAAHYESQGASLALPEELWGAAKLLQESRLLHDPWLDVIQRGLDIAGVCHVLEGQRRVATTSLMGVVLDIPKERQQQHHWKRIAPIMRKLGWEGPKWLRFPRISKDGKISESYLEKGYFKNN